MVLPRAPTSSTTLGFSYEVEPWAGGCNEGVSFLLPAFELGFPEVKTLISEYFKALLNRFMKRFCPSCREEMQCREEEQRSSVSKD